MHIVITKKCAGVQFFQKYPAEDNSTQFSILAPWSEIFL
jgi:hypothetical protein